MRPTAPSSLHIVRLALLFATGVLACGPKESHDDWGADPLLSADALSAPPRIRSLSVVGSGCPAPEEFSVTATRESFSSDLSGYVVVAAAGAPEALADCEVTLVLDAPDGVAYAPAGLDLSFSTDSTSAVMLATTASWTSTPNVAARTQSRISSGGWRSTHTVLDGEEPWSSCVGHRELRLATKLRLEPAQGRPGYASVHAISNLRFAARRCEPEHPGADAGSTIDAGGTTPNTSTSGDGGAPPLPDGGIASPDGGDARGEPEVQITNVMLVGLGCPRSAARVEISEDRRSFQVHPGQFVAENAEGAFAYRHCAFLIDVAAPPGYRTELESFQIDGSMQLAAGAIVNIMSSYQYPAPSIRGKEKSLQFAGPRNEPFSMTMDFGTSSSGSSWCGPNLTTMLDVLSDLAGGPSVTVSIDRVHSWKLRLERCR